jgi:hypothetical protein
MMLTAKGGRLYRLSETCRLQLPVSETTPQPMLNKIILMQKHLLNCLC